GQVAAHLAAHGRTPVGWDDELVAGATLPAAEVVMSWHGNDGERVALAALRQAYDTVVIPHGASAAEAGHVIGVQAGLWTELMPDFARDQHALYPRIAALAELGWSPAAAHDWRGFLQRLPAELARYRALGIDYADTAFAAAFEVTAGAGDTLRVALANQTDFGTIRYTTDGSAPTPTSTPYVRPLALPARDRTMLRAATFAPDGYPLAAPRTKVLDAATLLGRDGSQLAACSHQPGMRLGGQQPTRGPRPVYTMEVGDMCWLWPQAPLAGVTHVDLSVARVTWRFGDEAKDAVVRPKASASGEFEIHADSCTGPLLARLPLAPVAQAPGQIRLGAPIATLPGNGVRDLCIVATGDPRDGQWALARITFSKDSTKTGVP